MVCTKMADVALFVVVKNWKHPRCPTIEDGCYQLWHLEWHVSYASVVRDEVNILRFYKIRAS